MAGFTCHFLIFTLFINMLINSIVLKTASRCNLNCSYCYIYNKGDLSYQVQPKFFSTLMVSLLLERVLEYMDENNLKGFAIVFHGGEPMLNGVDFYRYFIKEYERIFSLHPDKRIAFVMQTNGTLLNEENVKVLVDLKIHVGVSMDTTKESNDTYRVYHNKTSSYDEIVQGFNLLKKHYPDAGILSVIDVNHSAIETYEHIKSMQTSYVDLLFPDETHDTISTNDIRGKLGDWLCDLFDLWFEDKTEKPVIRVFKEMIQLLLGTGTGYDPFGKNRGDTIVVESNGDIQSNDTFRVCTDGITKSKFNIASDKLSVIHNDPLAKLYYNNHFDLPNICMKCPIEPICAGGYVINRFRKQNGFDNESVYCDDLVKFIVHIQNRLALISKDNLDLELLNYNEIIGQIEETRNEKKIFPHLINYAEY